jgi:hypothetical protein
LLYDRIASAPLRGPASAPSLPPWRPGPLAGARGGGAASHPGGGSDVRCWIELSPNVEGFPAAGTSLAMEDAAEWIPPFELMRASGIAGMSLCLVSEGGRELGRWWVDAGFAENESQTWEPSSSLRAPLRTADRP